MAVTEAAGPHKDIELSRRRQTLVVAWLLLLLAVFVAAVFGAGSWGDGNAVFRLTRPNDAIPLPSLVVAPGSYSLVVAAVLAFFGVRLFLRGGARWSSLLLGIGFLLLVTAFLAWATAGKSFFLTGMLQSTMVRAVPIALGGLAGVLCERVAVINIGIEGMLLAGAFTASLIASVLSGVIGTGSLIAGVGGVVAAVLVGGLFGIILAALVVTYRVDQIVAGVAINLFVLGLTSYVSSQVLTHYRVLNNAPVFRSIYIPYLSDLPVVGPVLFRQNIFVYGALILVAIATYYLFHTRSGLRARAVGEHPEAADTLGINVYKTALHQRDAGRHGGRLRRRVVHARHGRPLRREHDRRARLHRAGRDDLRALASGRRADGGAGLRLRRLAAAEARHPADADPLGVPGHGALYRHHRAGGRPDRAREAAGRRRQALHQGMSGRRR